MKTSNTGKYRLHSVLALLLGIGVLSACADETSNGPDDLGESETYRWCAQPITFSPLGPPWESGRNQQGGRRGVSFTRKGSVPNRISVAEAFFLGNQDRTSQLRALRDNVETMEQRDVSRAIALARPVRTDFHTSAQARVIEATSNKLSDALADYVDGYPDRAARAVDAALRIYSGLTYSIDDILDRVQLDPGDYPPGIGVTIHQRTRRTVAGFDAVQIDYLIDEGHRTSTCRDVYLVADNHAFVFRGQGPPEVLETFEALLATVSFSDTESASSL